ncbi:MAG TPA: DUF1761 domain-containing protein [Planctomycetota bacterium]|nr:DUF1761 domain-containing protein [Planctomycetota bacterium]
MKINLDLVNWAAVAVAGVAAFMIGGIWYSAVFGKLWIKLQGWSDEKVAEMKATMSPAKFLGGQLASCLVLAFTVALLVVTLELRTVTEGACLGAILWLGPAAAIGLMGQLASGRRGGLYFIDTGHQFVSLVTQGIIIASWR